MEFLSLFFLIFCSDKLSREAYNMLVFDDAKGHYNWISLMTELFQKDIKLSSMIKILSAYSWGTIRTRTTNLQTITRPISVLKERMKLKYNTKRFFRHVCLDSCKIQETKRRAERSIKFCLFKKRLREKR